jgi:cytoskeletal protein CcmA (bactofilin family)
MTPTPPSPEAPPSRRFTDIDRSQVTTIGAGLRLEGDLDGVEGLELAGKVEGSIKVEGLCHLHRTARVVGPVTAGDAVVEGELKGPLTVRGRLELRATARVEGDITAGSVALADGCYFEGHIHMEGSGGGEQPTSFQEKRRVGPEPR